MAARKRRSPSEHGLVVTSRLCQTMTLVERDPSPLEGNPSQTTRLTLCSGADIIRAAGRRESYGPSWSPWSIGSEGETDIPAGYGGWRWRLSRDRDMVSNRLRRSIASDSLSEASHVRALRDASASAVRTVGFSARARAPEAGHEVMSVVVQRRPEPSGIPARILVAGSDLLAGALASALEAYGFATRHIVPREPEIERGIEWRPNLVLIDVRSLDVTSGSALHRPSCAERASRVCVIDAADDGDRLNAWMGAGTSALDRRERAVRPTVPDDQSPPSEQALTTADRTKVISLIGIDVRCRAAAGPRAAAFRQF